MVKRSATIKVRPSKCASSLAIKASTAVFDSAIPDNYELLKVIPIIDINLFKGKDITFGLVFRPTIKEIINEK